MIVIENTKINNMEEAYDFLKEKYKNYTVDIWFEKHGIQEIIHIEDIYDAIHYQDKFTSIEEVKKFVKSGGFENM